LAQELARGGSQVIILSRRPHRVAGLPAGIEARPWDGCSSQGWASLADGADALVNLAGENIGSRRWTGERKRLIIESRLNAGRAVVEAIKVSSRKPRVVIQASGVGYYGPGGDKEIGDDSPPGHDFLSRLATDWEASTAGVEGVGVRRVIIRTGVVLSARGGALTRMLLPFRLFVGGRLGSGRQWLPWIHIADEVAAIRFLMEDETASGAFNLTAPAPVTNAEFSRSLGRQLRRPSLVPMPGFALRGLFGEMSTVILDGQRAVPRRLAQAGFRFKFGNLDAALSDLFRRR
jgi:uncharacterized protein (TIGR01777 family)